MQTVLEKLPYLYIGYSNGKLSNYLAEHFIKDVCVESLNSEVALMIPQLLFNRDIT